MPYSGFDSSPSEILSFPLESSFSGGFFDDKVSFMQTEISISHRPIITFGIGIDNKIG